MRPLFSICHTTARLQGWQESHRAWVEGAIIKDSFEYILCKDERWGFHPYVEEPGLKTVWNKGPRNSVSGWNTAAAASTGHIIILNADDMFPSAGWDSKILGAIPDMSEEAVLRVSTFHGSDWSGLITLGIMTRPVYERWGYALYPEYESMCSDADFTEHADQDGIIIDAPEIYVEHRHPFIYGSPNFEAPLDEVYEYQNRPQAYQSGYLLLALRRTRRFESRASHEEKEAK